MVDQNHQATEAAIKLVFRSPDLIIDKRNEIDDVITKIVMESREFERPGEPEGIISDLEMYLRMGGVDLSDLHPP